MNFTRKLDSTLRAIFYALLLSTPMGCSGGGGSCGDVPNGQACMTDDECGCGLVCAEVCTKVYGQPNVEPADLDANRSVPVSSTVRAVCDRIMNQPCVAQEMRASIDGCHAVYSQGEARATEAGCGNQVRSLFACLGSKFRCAEGADGDQSFANAQAACAGANAQLEACAGPCNRGRGTTCGGPSEGNTCSVSTRNSCDQGAAATCETVEDATGPRWRCTCGVGVNQGAVFDTYSGDCCGSSHFIEEACGYVTVEPDDDGEISSGPGMSGGGVGNTANDDPCQTNFDCASELCAEVGDRRICVRECSEGECAEGYRCLSDVCIPDQETESP